MSSAVGEGQVQLSHSYDLRVITPDSGVKRWSVKGISPSPMPPYDR